MPVNTFAKSLLLISLMSLGMLGYAQQTESVSRNMTYSHFGVPVIAEETGDGMLRIYYEVRPGNTLYSISRQFDLSVEEIRNMNDLANNLIYTGQKLLVRSETVEQEAETTVAFSESLQKPMEEVKEKPILPSEPEKKVIPKKEPENIAEPSGELILIDNLESQPAKSGAKSQHSFGQ